MALPRTFLFLGLMMLVSFDFLSADDMCDKKMKECKKDLPTSTSFSIENKNEKCKKFLPSALACIASLGDDQCRKRVKDLMKKYKIVDMIPLVCRGNKENGTCSSGAVTECMTKLQKEVATQSKSYCDQTLKPLIGEAKECFKYLERRCTRIKEQTFVKTRIEEANNFFDNMPCPQ